MSFAKITSSMPFEVDAPSHDNHMIICLKSSITIENALGFKNLLQALFIHNFQRSKKIHWN